MPAASGAALPLADAQRLAGIADALELTREEAGRLRDGRRTQTVTWRQLDDALAVLAAKRATGARRRRGHRGAARRRSPLEAETMADIARALAIERGDDTGADMLFWAEATRSSIESHRRDLDQVDGCSRLVERAPLGP